MSRSVPTAATREKLLTLLRLGAHRAMAARYSRIAPRELSNWLAKGRRASRGVLREFYLAICEAESSAEIQLLKQWRELSKESWQASAGLLERRFPTRWAKVSPAAARQPKRASDEPPIEALLGDSRASRIACALFERLEFVAAGSGRVGAASQSGGLATAAAPGVVTAFPDGSGGGPIAAAGGDNAAAARQESLD